MKRYNTSVFEPIAEKTPVFLSSVGFSTKITRNPLGPPTGERAGNKPCKKAVTAKYPGENKKNAMRQL
jgi:hypothetical protein